MDSFRNLVPAVGVHRQITSANYMDTSSGHKRPLPLGGLVWLYAQNNLFTCCDQACLTGHPHDWTPTFQFPFGVALQSAKDGDLFAVCTSGDCVFQPRITLSGSFGQKMNGRPVIVDSTGTMLEPTTAEALMGEAVMKTSSDASDDDRIVLTDQTLDSGMYYHIGTYIRHASGVIYHDGGSSELINSLIVINFNPKFIFKKA